MIHSIHDTCASITHVFPLITHNSLCLNFIAMVRELLEFTDASLCLQPSFFSTVKKCVVLFSVALIKEGIIPDDALDSLILTESNKEVLVL
ncbi:hypothetical protein H5410_038355 [Solanum commersonii]|uniref:Uncharacterized protein n=1 Tax=Solanum commersonii TaxID=4109 RepID=A0A9J5Y8R2_SOLCO|nr:hypothetical protein H5410_038355 [Solanum commersonii]